MYKVIKYKIPYNLSNFLIFSDGRVFNLKKNRFCSQTNHSLGYSKVFVYYDDGVQKQEYVHRLIATCFIPNPHNLPLVNHIDGNKKNNDCRNLEWCDYYMNLVHDMKLKNSVRRKLDLNKQQISFCRNSTFSSRTLAQMLGVCHTTVQFARKLKYSEITLRNINL